MGKVKKSESSETSEQAPSTEEGDIDFTKPLPKDFMPSDIKTFGLKDDEDDDSSVQPSENEESPDFFNDGSAPTSPETEEKGSYKKKVLAFIMIFPMIVTALTMMGDIASKFNIDKVGVQMTATLGGAGIALFVLSRVPQLREAIKFVLCFAWVIFLLPTYQVYSCSPVELPNSMLGTWFKLATNQNDFLEKTYITSECFNKLKLQSPYMLSAVPLKISVVVQINELINLEEQEGQEDDTKYFLAVSKRSVKRKFHNLYLIIEASGSSASILAKSLKWSKSEQDKNLLVVTGSIYDLEDELLPMKKELEKMQYLVRPIKMKASSVNYRDKYAKFKPVRDESLY